jgi:hypothetical protein
MRRRTIEVVSGVNLLPALQRAAADGNALLELASSSLKSIEERKRVTHRQAARHLIVGVLLPDLSAGYAAKSRAARATLRNWRNWEVAG